MTDNKCDKLKNFKFPDKCCTREEYLKFARVLHPDKNNECKEIATEKMQELNEKVKKNFPRLPSIPMANPTVPTTTPIAGKSIQYIESLYGKFPSYFDNYGLSLIIVIVLSIILIITIFSFQTMETLKKSGENWEENRCKAPNAFIGGFVHKPSGKGVFEYTSENFSYCLQNMSNEIVGKSVQPYYSILTNIANTMNGHSQSVNESRNLLANIRSSFSGISETSYNKIMNVVIEIQKMIIALSDSLNKSHGVMTASLYTSLGTYFSLKSLIGSILELIIEILIAVAIIIASLWVVPVTWGAAASMTASFLAISIPLAMIAAFMTIIMGIHTENSIPVLKPPKLRCFGKFTILELDDGTFKNISDVKCGEILKNGDMVTAIMELSAENLNMYDLDGIIISESHKVFYEKNWIYASKHPNSKKIKYNDPYVYCLNTVSKRINIDDHIFLDWDELYDDSLYKVLSVCHNKKNIHNLFNKGIDENSLILCNNRYYTKIEHVNIDDIIEGESIVYGKVKMIDGKNIKYNLLTVPNYFKVNNKCVYDYNYAIDIFLKNYSSSNNITDIAA